METREHYFIADCGEYYGLYRKLSEVGKTLHGVLYKNDIDRLRAYVGDGVLVIKEEVYSITWAN